jgi:lipooligosaccharide transport system permease protein
LYHAVELIRGLCVGNLTPDLLGHTVYLVAMAVLGFAVTARRFGRFLQG